MVRRGRVPDPLGASPLGRWGAHGWRSILGRRGSMSWTGLFKDGAGLPWVIGPGAFLGMVGSVGASFVSALGADHHPSKVEGDAVHFLAALIQALPAVAKGWVHGSSYGHQSMCWAICAKGTIWSFV